MCSQLTQDQNDMIRNLAIKEDISDYELEVVPASEKGDGYLGTILSVILKNSSKKLCLIIKAAETNEEVRKKVVVVRAAYLREIHIYNKIFPEFERFQKENNLKNRFNAYAKIFGSNDDEGKEYICLENLKENGYKMWNRKVPMNSDHVAMVFSEYGKLHAVSLAMSEKEPELFKEVTKDLRNIFHNVHSKEEAEYGIKLTIGGGLKAVKGDDYATAALLRFSEEAVTFILDELELPEDGLVITHGDCWCNNMMFKYEDKENPQKPTTMCLLDWQLSKLGTPAMDLAYFFIVCSSKDVLYDVKKYLKIYHEALSETLRNLGCDSEKLFPYTLLEHHWKKYAKYGLYMSLIIVRLMLSEKDEVPTLTETKPDENIFERFIYENSHIEEFNQRMSDIVHFMADQDLI